LDRSDKSLAVTGSRGDSVSSDRAGKYPTRLQAPVQQLTQIRRIQMSTVIVIHEVDDVDHWVASPKRAEFFGAHGMTVRTFVDPAGGNRVGVIVENVPSLDALTEALAGPDAAAAMAHDGVRPDTVQMFVAS
jgi:hypothetical protein